MTPRESSDFARDLSWGRSNSLVLAAGLVLLAAGYLIMWIVRQDAVVWLGRLSPFCIMAGYATVFASVLVGDGRENQNHKNDRDT